MILNLVELKLSTKKKHSTLFLWICARSLMLVCTDQLCQELLIFVHCLTLNGKLLIVNSFFQLQLSPFTQASTAFAVPGVKIAVIFVELNADWLNTYTSKLVTELRWTTFTGGWTLSSTQLLSDQHYRQTIYFKHAVLKLFKGQSAELFISLVFITYKRDAWSARQTWHPSVLFKSSN